MRRSLLALSLSLVHSVGSRILLASSSFMLNLNAFRNGHIMHTKFSLPSSDCSSSRDTFSFVTMLLIIALVARAFSSGNFQERLVESNYIPRTFPRVVFEKALSQSSQSSASSMSTFLHILL
jgi:hypothetical protein